MLQTTAISSLLGVKARKQAPFNTFKDTHRSNITQVEKQPVDIIEYIPSPVLNMSLTKVEVALLLCRGEAEVRRSLESVGAWQEEASERRDVAVVVEVEGCACMLARGQSFPKQIVRRVPSWPLDLSKAVWGALLSSS